MGDSNTNGITASYQLASHDVVRDVTMTSPGMSSQDGPQLRDLGKLFDRQIEMLQTLKIEAMNTQQALEGKVALLEKEGKELKAKLISREAEIVQLKQEMKKLSQLASSAEQSSSLSAGSSDTDSPNWRKMYEDMKTRYEDLKHRQLQGCSLPGSGNHRNRAVVVTTSPLLGVPDHGVQGAGDRINSLPTSLPSIQQKSSEALQLVKVDHAYDLADRVSVPQFRHVLRKLHVSDTDIANLDMNRSDAKEFFVQGIQLWKSEAGGKANVQALIKALLDLKLCLQALEFCNHFGFVCPQEEKDERPSQISVSQDSTDGVADSPAVLTPAYIPKSKLDTILHPFLLDPSGFDDLNQGLSNQSSFDEEEVEKFAKLSNIKSCDYDLFKSVISVGGETVGPDVMLEAWAEVEVQKTPLSRSREQSVHSLGKVLRELQRRDIRHILVSHLESGLLGPWLDNKVFFRDKRVPYSFARDLGHLLSSSTIGQADWRIFASDVGFSEHIKQFERRQTPGMEVLDAWKTKKESTIGYLYSWAKEKDRMDIVKMLEEGVKN